MVTHQCIVLTCAVRSVKHKPDGNKKNPDGSQKLLTCAQEGTSEIGDFLMLDTSGKGQTIFWTYDVLFEVGRLSSTVWQL